MFQFLIGSLQTLYNLLAEISLRWFQFLIGSLQTPDAELARVLDSSEFQFLIGSLQTPSSKRRPTASWSFNSLQVVYKLFLQFHCITVYTSFNSLQVVYKPIAASAEKNQRISFNSLQVVYKPTLLGQMLSMSEVSIPYRQSTNAQDPKEESESVGSFNSLQVVYKPWILTLGMPFSSVSIPYRQSTNREKTPTPPTPSLEFQFLIGSLQTKSTRFLQEHSDDVSIPYRQSTNVSHFFVLV